MIKGIKKRVLTTLLAGTLMFSGVFVYGSAINTVAGKAEAAAQTVTTEQTCQFNGIESDLGLLVSEGVITHAQKVTIINAIENSGLSQAEILKLVQSESKTLYDRLAESGAIARSLADTVEKAIKAKKEMKYIQKIEPKAQAASYTAAIGKRI